MAQFFRIIQRIINNLSFIIKAIINFYNKQSQNGKRAIVIVICLIVFVTMRAVITNNERMGQYQVKYNQAKVLFENGELGKAETIINEALGYDNTSSEAIELQKQILNGLPKYYSDLAQQSYNKLEYEVAISFSDKALNLNPSFQTALELKRMSIEKHIDNLLVRADVLKQDQKYIEAYAVVKKALEFDSSNANARIIGEEILPLSIKEQEEKTALEQEAQEQAALEQAERTKQEALEQAERNEQVALEQAERKEQELQEAKSKKEDKEKAIVALLKNYVFNGELAVAILKIDDPLTEELRYSDMLSNYNGNYFIVSKWLGSAHKGSYNVFEDGTIELSSENPKKLLFFKKHKAANFILTSKSIESNNTSEISTRKVLDDITNVHEMEQNFDNLLENKEFKKINNYFELFSEQGKKELMKKANDYFKKLIKENNKLITYYFDNIGYNPVDYSDFIKFYEELWFVNSDFFVRDSDLDIMYDYISFIAEESLTLNEKKWMQSISELDTYVNSRVQNSSYFEIGGYGFNEKYLNEYVISSYDYIFGTVYPTSDYTAVLKTNENISQGVLSGYVSYVGTSEYITGSGFKTTANVYVLLTDEQLREYYNYVSNIDLIKEKIQALYEMIN